MALLDIYPNDLLLCIDETGSEALTDQKHPFFGFGGCAIPGSIYAEAVELPWKSMKREHFGSENAPLHAAKLPTSNVAGLKAVGRFFQESPVARFATIMTTSTRITGETSDAHLALSLCLSDQIGRVLQVFRYHRLVLAFEQSERGDPQVRRHFSQLQPILDGPDGPFRGPVERCFIPKRLAFPCMEIADFIVQAAGAQGRAQMQPTFRLRSDFNVIFQPAPHYFAEVMYADAIHVTRRDTA